MQLMERLKTLVIVLIALVSLYYAAGRDTIRFFTTDWVRVWNVYHYYLGSKYFRELGYFDIYDASLLADSESGEYWRRITKVRNLRTYEVEPRSVSAARYDPSTRFTPERWSEFQKDLAALQPQMEDWKNVFRDRGYNPSPFWNAVGAFISNRLSAQSLLQLKLLTILDLLLFILTFAGIAWAFGTRNAAWVMILLALTPVNDGRLVGGFLQYDWYCAFALALCFLKKRYPVLAAAFASYAVLARIFPAVLMISGFLAVLFVFIRRRQAPAMYVRFFSFSALFLAAGIFIGAAGSGGSHSWVDFASKIQFHSAEHTFGERRIGLKHIFTHDMLSTGESASVLDRKTAFQRNRAYSIAAAVILMLAWLASVHREYIMDAFILGLVAVFALTVSSRYYWAYLSFVPLLSMVTTSARRRRVFALAGQGIIFAALFLLQEVSRPDPYVLYSAFNLMLLFYLATLALWRPVAIRWVRSRRG